MGNCIVAQSGGPSPVINASVMGVLDQNREIHHFDHVYAGIYGIEGMLKGRTMELSSLPYEEIKNLKYTPSSGLGSCRYKMKDFKKDDSEYKKLFDVLKKLQIETFFYIGGNDSMDTVHRIDEYAKKNDVRMQVVGIPKTIDNDLVVTDHTPGFGSAAKFISTITLETYLDFFSYSSSGIYVLETMGRDTGWLAASAALAKINGVPAVDFIYLPELAFDNEKFLNDIKEKLKLKNRIYIVVSEGLKDSSGNFISHNGVSSYDKFGHTQLGGISGYLHSLLLEKKLVSRVKTLELGAIQRSSMHCASEVDIEEAYMVGRAAYNYSIEEKTGIMVGIKRVGNDPYHSEAFAVEASLAANNIKYFPLSWINSEGNNVTKEAVDYISPLIVGTPNLDVNLGLPKYVKLSES